MPEKTRLPSRSPCLIDANVWLEASSVNMTAYGKRASLPWNVSATRNASSVHTATGAQNNRRKHSDTVHTFSFFMTGLIILPFSRLYTVDSVHQKKRRLNLPHQTYMGIDAGRSLNESPAAKITGEEHNVIHIHYHVIIAIA